MNTTGINFGEFLKQLKRLDGNTNAYRSTLTPPDTQGALDAPAFDDLERGLINLGNALEYNKSYPRKMIMNDVDLITKKIKVIRSNLDRTALTRPSREEKLLNEIVSAYNDLHEFFDVDNGTEPDGDSIGWQGDMELPTTFGQLRRLKQAIAEAGE